MTLQWNRIRPYSEASQNSIRRVASWKLGLAWIGLGMVVQAQESIAEKLAIPPKAAGTIRVATFNVALNRESNGQLAQDLKKGDAQARRVATVIQLVSPDILLANEVDYGEGESAKLFLNSYLNASQTTPVKTESAKYTTYFTAPVNTGVPSGLDLNLNGRSSDSDDAWGYGAFPGQYGMVVYSRYPIAEKSVRTFQMFPWNAMPNAKRPKLVDKETGKEKFFHNDEVWKQLRLSSKSHWDVPIEIDGHTLHILASHPTPPVFDGPEDRNGCRNHDEIRMLRDYVSGDDDGKYLVDDRGRAGGLPADAAFVILGDLNSDPKDGSGIAQGIIDLLESPRVSSKLVPTSSGAVEAATQQGGANAKHQGNPAHDTGDFNDKSVGNLRIDFALPSSQLKVVGGGVFWPTEQQLQDIEPELATASDHHLVWIDIQFATK